MDTAITWLMRKIVWTALQATFDQQVERAGEGSAAVGRGVLAMIFLYGLAFNIGWSPLQVTYVVEILPYNLRAKVSDFSEIPCKVLTPQ